MEHYSSTKLRSYLKYEDGLAVLDLNATNIPSQIPDAGTELSNGKKLVKIPDAVTELSEIEKLVVTYKNLTELPASISKLKNLIVLKLDNNKIRELPPEIGDLRELREMWLRYNHELVGLPTSIQRLVVSTA